jgi:hypothetical protein
LGVIEPTAAEVETPLSATVRSAMVKVGVTL